MTKILITMKIHFKFLMLLIFGSSFLNAQNINWSGIMKDNAGNALANTSVALTFSILEGPGETLVYRETHNATTGSSGLVSAEIGGGTVNAGVFANLDFTKPYKLRTEGNSGNGNVILGTTDFKAVPLAKSAVSAVSAQSAVSAEATEKLKKGTASIEIDDANKILMKENGSTSMSISNGKVNVPSLSGNGTRLLQVTNTGGIEVKPSTTQIEYYNVGGSALQYPGYQFFGDGGFYNVNGDPNPKIHVPLNLPPGKLRRLTMEFLDASITSGLNVRLVRSGKNPQTDYAILGTLSTGVTFTSTSWYSVNMTIPTEYQPILNNVDSFFLEISAIGNWSATLRINKFIFEIEKND